MAEILPTNNYSAAVNVVVRIRGPSNASNASSSIKIFPPDTLQITSPDDGKTHQYNFDSIFGPDSTQENIFDAIGQKVIKHVLEGFNNSIFAYGISGSGKTYTIMGLIPKLVTALIQSGANISASYYEIYSEKIYDLLTPAADEKELVVREHPKNGPYIVDLSSHPLQNEENLNQLMRRGNLVRATSSTNMNDRSSRSHAILSLKIKQEFSDYELVSNLNIIDLAGSERINVSGVKGINIKESLSINSSLSALGLVINKLSETQSAMQPATPRGSHIPYRNSVLTWILKDSLGGNSRSYMIATITPNPIYYNENMNTLNYARSAKKITNTVHINIHKPLKSSSPAQSPRIQSPQPSEELKIIEELKKLLFNRDETIEELKKDNVQKTNLIKELDQKNKELDQTNKELDKTNKELDQKNKELDKTNKELDQTNKDLNVSLENMTKKYIMNIHAAYAQQYRKANNIEPN